MKWLIAFALILLCAPGLMAQAELWYVDTTYNGTTTHPDIDTVMRLDTVSSGGFDTLTVSIASANDYNILFITDDSIPADDQWPSTLDSLIISIAAGAFNSNLRMRVVMVDTTGAIVDSHAWTSTVSTAGAGQKRIGLASSDAWDAGSIWWRLGVQVDFNNGTIGAVTIKVRFDVTYLESDIVTQTWPPDPPVGGGNNSFLASPAGRAYMARPGGKDYRVSP